MAEFDLAIIGGGINGAGIARDAAGRGLKVLLVEQHDLASGTSSASTKLIHGGLRYLEHGAFRLVREALEEREVLLRMAPHVVRPIRFVLPAQGGARPGWLLRIGLLIYDHLGGRKILPATKILDLTHNPYGQPLKRRFISGFEYSDCVVDDARLVVLNALDAAERGATIRTRARCVRAERGEEWRLVLNNHGRREIANARVLVNAAGPWVGLVADSVIRTQDKLPLRLVKGSHIVVKKLFEHDRGYIFQSADKRVVFAVPFHGDFTLIGTTDQAFVGDPATVVPSSEEINYLCGAMNEYFRDLLLPVDALWAFAGVRSLYDDGSTMLEDITRDYVLAFDQAFRSAPLITVYGGKITTYRRLAEAAIAKIADMFVPGPPWTDRAPLPGGDFAHDRLEQEVARGRTRWPFLPEGDAHRLVCAYGTRLERILANAASFADLGQHFGAGLTAAEVRYLMQHEWAETADDVLWRRSKLGLKMNAGERAVLAQFMADQSRPALAMR